MSLRVHVRSASDLPGLNKLGGKSDPYCVLSFKRQKRQTEYILNELNPVWKKDFSWDLREPLDSSDVLKVKVLDYEKIGFAQFIGRLTVSLASLTVRKELSVHENLLSKQGKSIKGKIQLEVFYSPPACAEGKHHSKPGPYSTPDGLDNTVHDERRHEALRQKAEKQKLPKKPIDFQVRVHIMEARKLPGELLRSMVRVVCGRETRETTVKKGTANPHWSERFFFNMKELPDVVMDTLLEIKVFNVKMLMKDALIGSFKLDLGVVYDEPEHCFVHKWLLLTHPDDPSGKSKGYLKCSIVMIGPGDDPVSPYSKMANEDTDIESNLLRPAGAQLQPATLTIRLLKAEDLPQMDQDYFNRIKKTFFPSASKKQNLVDPYCSVLYAGHTGETDVVYNCQDPIWNQQIKLGVRFPLLSDRIRFTVKDRDQLTRDDIIGTFFLNMSHISAPGEDGFLPTFGPCFVNVYGSPREYSDAPDAYESINKGLYEGVAYRGRVMVEVEMQLGQLPENSLEDVSDADLRRAVRTMSVKPLQYTLHGAFLSATMVKPSDAVVEFEVSIGDKGYLVNGEGDGTDVTSLTPPMKPVYDGHMYHYLPWLETKPCVLVESQWQDCQYRLDTLNYLLHAANHLEHGLGEVRRRLQRKCCYEEDLKGALLSAIALFEDDLGGLMEWTSKKTPLPKMYTRLDACLKESRHRKLKHMYKELMHLKEHHLLSSSQKHSKMSCEAMADECEDYLMELKNLAVEPQNCIPDVILWMLSDGKRVAYHRIPSHLLVFSEDVRFKGSKCGRIQTIILGPAGQEKLIGEEFDSKCGAQLRLMLWLGRKDVGLVGAKDGWTAGLLDTEESVYAETYENQQNFLGKWGGSFLTVPLWSDVTGRVNQPRDTFRPPPGWKWALHQDWKISTGCSDALLHLVHSEWKDEVYEHQDRRPLAPWPSTSYWISLSGEILRTASSGSRDQDRLLTGEDLQGQLSLLPQGWEWKDKQWTIDSEKPTDSEGWEYTMKIGSRYGSWLSYEKKTDLSRRRRWVRKRRRVDDPSPLLGVKVQQKALCTSEGWLYGSSRSGPFHPQERVFDMFRRRCWLRKMVSTGNTRSPPVFEFVHGREKTITRHVPRRYLEFKHVHYYQLRAYLYQARDMYSGDRGGLSDPYAVVSFEHYSDRSVLMKGTVSPKWNETLLFEHVHLCGHPEDVLRSPPKIVLQYFDKDNYGQDEFLGGTLCSPVVQIHEPSPPALEWYDITRYGKPAGELLAAFQLILDDDHSVPVDLPAGEAPRQFSIPADIVPKTQTMRVQLLCWGVRDMKSFLLQSVNSPTVEVRCGDVQFTQTLHIKDASKNPNFPGPRPFIIQDMELPLDPLYAPPLSIHVRDKRSFGYSPLVGLHVVKSISDHYMKPTDVEMSIHSIDGVEGSCSIWEVFKSPEDTFIKIDVDPDFQKKSEIDWWSKYYYSIGDMKKTQKEYIDEYGTEHGKMVVYPHELEKEFMNFTDFVSSFPLFRGKGLRDEEDESSHVVGYLKGSISVFPIPPIPPTEDIPTPEPTECLVRVYIVKAEELQPQDSNGMSDPYVKVKIGKHEINDRKSYIPNSLDPLFGRVYELPALLPIDHTLTISVMDHDRILVDDLIGTTSIDLENRYLSRHRAICGLPKCYFKRGLGIWRDQEEPRDILKSFCKAHGMSLPKWRGSSVELKGKTYTLDDFENPSKSEWKWLKENKHLGSEDQRLALHVLNAQQEEEEEEEDLRLVPEHIETRTLYNPMQPGISQGHLHMWVDVFPKSNPVIPPAVDISPRQPLRHYLRVIVWGTEDVVLNDKDEITGKGKTDIYVKGWIQGQDKVQKTDVHYRSLDGEGNFNWRFVFEFDYIPSERVMVVNKREHFYNLDKTEQQLPPRLTIQVWDNDIFTPDDYLGTLEVDLHAVPKPAKSSNGCSLKQLADYDVGAATGRNTVSIFKQKWVKGWWPVFTIAEGEKEMMGKVLLEMELVTDEEHDEKPAGKGREEPNMNPHLPSPYRPPSSFLWLTSPFKVFRFLIWEEYAWPIIGVLMALFLVIPVLVIVCSLLSDFANYTLNELVNDEPNEAVEMS